MRSYDKTSYMILKRDSDSNEASARATTTNVQNYGLKIIATDLLELE